VTGAAAGAGYPYAALQELLAREPRAVLVCVASARGSTPREAGAAMIVTPTRAIGTIGGGKLEFEALRIARDALSQADAKVAWASLVRFPLAAGVGQCCGGVATLAFATFSTADGEWLAQIGTALQSGVSVAVLIGIGPDCSPRMSVSAADACGSLGDDAADATAIALARARLAAGDAGVPRATIEHAGEIPVLVHLPATGAFDVFLFGNGHVGRALAHILGALPARVRWIDAREADFPSTRTANVEIIATDVPEAELRAAPPGSYVVVSTHSHALDFELVAAALARDDWSYLGMIGSRAKKAQLLRRLVQHGLPPQAIDRVACPIGSATGLPRGKEPGTIAVAVAAEMLALRERLLASAPAGSPPAAA
jgi:xanthine dehydrogenase accessory factor